MFLTHNLDDLDEPPAALPARSEPGTLEERIFALVHVPGNHVLREHAELPGDDVEYPDSVGTAGTFYPSAYRTGHDTALSMDRFNLDGVSVIGYVNNFWFVCWTQDESMSLKLRWRNR